MAATLMEGKQYGLASNVSTSGNQTVIHFKLTDSAYRALEEYSKFKGGCSRKPTIQFSSNNGVMCIPSQASSGDPKAERSFRLNLAELRDANGSFDCIQQINTRQGSSLQCLGSMQFKVSTHANNDVYTDTRKKIAIADTESKKSCAKEIKMSSRFKGKTIKKVIPSSHFKALQTARATTTRPVPNPPTSQSPLARGRITPPPSSGHSPYHPVSGNRVAGKPASTLVSSNGVLKIGGHAGNKQSSGAINMPYRERVIHLLALRSYKKPELLARLMKDGIREKDKNSLGAVLKSVSVMNKDNSYSLAKHAWQEVRSDWPYYTDADRQLLKKNQQQQESRRSVSPSVSPAAPSTDCPSPPQVPQKRSTDNIPDLIPNKKQRISHQHKHQTRTSGKAVHDDPTNSNHYKASVAMASSAAADKDSIISKSPTFNHENHEKTDEDSVPSDFVTQYTSIQTCAQRRQYKEDFDKDYAEYQHLHKKVKNVSRQFQNFKERILNTKEGTDDFEELRAKVMQEYEKRKNDKQYWQDRQRLSYLHDKLAHIKDLVAEYDKHSHTTACT